jgi:endonuclease/exonuclease/phosphatase family metal-dependent hydrolase
VVAILLAAAFPATATARTDARDAASKANEPARITSAKGVPGPRPGQTTFRWKTSGDRTDYYKITTALTPFGPRHGAGRHTRTFVVSNPNRRSLTLTAKQTASAGAALNTGFRLFFRIKAVNTNGSSSNVRPYKHLRHATINGQSSRMNGAQLRVAQFNVRVEASDVRGHRWKGRQRLVARTIARVHPDVMGVQELMPAMWNGQSSGPGLKRSLKRAHAGYYRLTRSTGYFRGAAQDTRILYNTRRLEMTSSCPRSRPSCYISIPGRGHREVAAYARFRDRRSGTSFYVVSAHLTAGNNASTDSLRGRQARAINAGINKVNSQNLPVVLVMDANSSQTSKGVDAPHTVLASAGWYNTIAAARTENLRYNSVQHFRVPQRPSPYGFGSIYDTIMTRGMPGADLFKQVMSHRPAPSDHNLVFAEIRLPR